MKTAAKCSTALKIAALVLAVFSADQAGAQSGEKDDIAVVEFGANGVAQGKYQQVVPGKWVELDADGNVQFKLEEISRDDTGIHLVDPRRGIALTLDIKGGAVTSGAIGAPEEPILEIISSAPAAAASAEADEIAAAQSDPSQNPVRIIFGTDSTKQGEYVLLEAGKWAELNSSGEPVFAFDEVSRSDTTVVVEDKSRNLSLTFDLAAKLISFGLIGESQEPLYKIIDVQLASGNQQDQPAPEAQPEETTSLGLQEEPAVAEPPGPGPVLILPSQIKLKHIGWYAGRFTVTWVEPDANGADTMKTWTSGEQPAPYFHALQLPETATSIKIVGEANTNSEWRIALERSIEHATNNCYVIAGTSMMQTGSVSEEPSDVLEDDCS